MPDTSVIAIGDHIGFQVIVEQPSGIRLEIMQLSDRIAVISQGEIKGIVKSEEADIEEIGLLMAGEVGTIR